MKAAGVIFDMDGVLVDSQRLHREAFDVLAAEVGVPFGDALFHDVFGQTNVEIFRRWLGEGLGVERVRVLDDRKEAIYRDLARDRLAPLPGMPELLNRLAGEGFRLAVGSSGPRENVELMLARFGWVDRFRATVTKDDVGRGKPDPEVFLRAAEGMDLAPSACVVVEDAPAGIEAARRAGMRCLAISSTRATAELGAADVVVDTFEAVMPGVFVRLLDGPPAGGDREVAGEAEAALPARGGRRGRRPSSRRGGLVV